MAISLSLTLPDLLMFSISTSIKYLNIPQWKTSTGRSMILIDIVCPLTWYTGWNISQTAVLSFVLKYLNCQWLFTQIMINNSSIFRPFFLNVLSIYWWTFKFWIHMTLLFLYLNNRYVPFYMPTVISPLNKSANVQWHPPTPLMKRKYFQDNLSAMTIKINVLRRRSYDSSAYYIVLCNSCAFHSNKM